MSDVVPYKNEISIDSVSILDENGTLLLEISTDNTSGQISLDYITFSESLNSPLIEGYLIFDGTKGQFEELQLIGNETLIISATTPSSDKDDEDSTGSFSFPDFAIYSFEDSSNLTDLNKTPESLTRRKITIKFCTKEGKELFEKMDNIPYGFIGKISSGLSFESITGDTGPNGEPGEVEIIDRRGLIEILSENFSSPIDTEPTLNHIWLRPKLVSLPSRKKLNKMNFLQTINYCKEFAVSEENQYAVNYYFWNDLNGWHFKSVDSLIRNAKTEIPVFSISSNILDPRRIYTFDVVSDFSEYSGIANKSIYSYYYRTSPDYFSSPYARFMDDREKYTTKKIVYNYQRMFPQISHIESSRLYKEKTEIDIDDLENPLLRSNDTMYGWMDQRAFNDYEDVNSILLLGDEFIEYGGSGDVEDNKGKALLLDGVGGSTSERYVSFDLANFDAYETRKWQEMYDTSNMDGELLKKIVTEIKQPIFSAKKKYRDRLAYKEQWNIYKYSVCCSVPEDEESIMAIIKESSLAGRNIYRYSWHEVIFIPKIELGIFAGATVETPEGPPEESDIPLDEYYYDLPVETINQLPIQYPFPANFKFVKYGITFDPEVVGDLSGEIFIGITGSSGATENCGITFEYENSVTRAISNMFDLCQDISGFTLTFHNDQYSPFLIVEKPNGARGTFENSSGAYNLNEILNRVVYNEETYPPIDGASLGSSLYFQSDGNGIRMPPDTPESTSELDVLVGPGINASKDNTEYPPGFASMPIGSYQLISPRDGSESTGVVCDPIPMGYITKISSVKTDDLPNYGIDIRKYGENGNLGSKTIYYFSATNAQDGKCDPLENCSIGETQP